ncbi:MAG: nucleoside-diphosphate sugar epimerase/dehydratase [Bacteroidales bacterium]|nr:nucleoside-diphosphate sugar epimerase/dehydratase [Bacteroidales bacterium]
MVRSSFTSRWIILSLDSFIATFSIVFSYLVCIFIYPEVTDELPMLGELVLVNLFIVSSSFLLFKTHSGIIRYSSYYEVWRIFMAISFSNILLAIGVFVFKFYFPISLTGLLINFTVSLLTLIALRYIIVKVHARLIMDTDERLERAVIYGTSPDSVALARAILMTRNRSFRLVGFMTYDYQIQQKRIMDLPVILLNGDLGRLLEGYEIDTIIFPDTKYISRNYDDLIRRCMSLKIKVLISQAPQDIADYSLKSSRIRNIQIEDLLGRDEIKINNDEISKQTQGKVVLVTGSAGSIGSELVRQLSKFKPKLIVLLDSAETPLHDMQLELEDKFKNLNFVVILGDVRDANRMTYVFKKFRPQIVYHAAAYKHVPLMEENPCESISVNVFGTRNIANHAIRYGAEKFVMISTDKAVNPSNVMGASKRIAEIYVQSLAKYIQKRDKSMQFITTRFGNVLGSNGSVIPRFRQQIEQGGPVTVTHPEITRFFMTIPEACRLVLEAGSMGVNGEIYVFDMGDPVKIDDMARRMIQLAGFTPNVDIEIVYSGLRPGEKLYEELLNDSEKTKPTRHEKIMVADVREYNLKEVIADLNRLIFAAQKIDIPRTVKLMKELVPEFISNNSEFEELDK